jgi:hypothetical protein
MRKEERADALREKFREKLLAHVQQDDAHRLLAIATIEAQRKEADSREKLVASARDVAELCRLVHGDRYLCDTKYQLPDGRIAEITDRGIFVLNVNKI